MTPAGPAGPRAFAAWAAEAETSQDRSDAADGRKTTLLRGSLGLRGHESLGPYPPIADAVLIAFPSDATLG